MTRSRDQVQLNEAFINDSNRLVTIVPHKVARVIAIVVVILILTGVISQVIKFTAGHRSVYGLIQLFDLEGEANIPAFFSALLLLFAALLVGVIWALKKTGAKSYKLHWGLLAFLLFYLATDEAAHIHELLGRPTEELIGTRATGIFYHAWVVPGIALVVLFALAYFRFLLHLPLRTRLLVFAGGAIYIGGALGVEMIGARYSELYGFDNLTYKMISNVEESFEMVGVIIFVFAMLDYIANSFGDVQILLKRPRKDEHPMQFPTRMGYLSRIRSRIP